MGFINDFESRLAGKLIWGSEVTFSVGNSFGQAS